MGKIKNKIKSKLFSDKDRCKAQGFKSGVIASGGKAVIGKEKKGVRVSYTKRGKK